MLSKKNKQIAFIEPYYYGVSLIQAASKLGHSIISIVFSKENPSKFNYEGKYDALIVADTQNSDSIVRAVQSSPYNGKLD